MTSAATRDPVNAAPSGAPAAESGTGGGNAVDGVDERSRVRRLMGPVGGAAVLALGALAVHVRDPHTRGSWGACPLLALTGLACPLCGGMRATNDLTNGQVGRAFWSNAVFVASLPLLALWWMAVVRDRWRGSARAWSWPLQVRGVMPAILVIAAVFFVLRNTPWGARLYP